MSDPIFKVNFITNSIIFCEQMHQNFQNCLRAFVDDACALLFVWLGFFLDLYLYFVVTNNALTGVDSSFF